VVDCFIYLLTYLFVYLYIDKSILTAVTADADAKIKETALC